MCGWGPRGLGHAGGTHLCLLLYTREKLDFGFPFRVRGHSTIPDHSRGATTAPVTYPFETQTLGTAPFEDRTCLSCWGPWGSQTGETAMSLRVHGPQFRQTIVAYQGPNHSRPRRNCAFAQLSYMYASNTPVLGGCVSPPVVGSSGVLLG